jgi:hypothetical protein
MPRLIFTPQADADLREIEENPAQRDILKAVRKCLGFLETNLRHPSFDDLIKSHQSGWQSKKLQMPGAQVMRSEAYFGGTPQGRRMQRNAADGLFTKPFSLNSHEFRSLKGPNGEKVFEAYAQQKTPGAYRVFWYYGPERGMITIVAIVPHP